MGSNLLKCGNHSDTLIVVLHEIYGINDHIKEICQKYFLQGYDVICPDLLCGEPFYDYDQEKEAYLYFTKTIGFQRASEQVTELLKQKKMNYEHIILVGYSIGATIAWLCSGNQLKLDGIIGFYGSRIRDYMEIDPIYSVLLIFPEEESSFNPKELKKELMKKEMVSVHIFEEKHGFADPYSANYNKKSAGRADRIVNNYLSTRIQSRETRFDR